jgi:hypothetical protein
MGSVERFNSKTLTRGNDEDDPEKKKNLKNAKGGHGQNFSGHKRAASK